MSCRLDKWRISGLPSLGKCPGFSLLGRGGASSKAADTGTAVGRIVELFHRFNDDTSKADFVVRQARTESAIHFPLADMDEAVTTGLMYMQDPRNWGEVVGELCEKTVTVELPPAPEDETGEPVKLVGHVDQIREVGGQLYVWDTKNGAAQGDEMVFNYALQLAGYAVAATHTLGRDVLPGGIIRTKGYRPKRRMRDPDTNDLRDRRPGEHRVFFPAQWSLSQCRSMLGTVVQHVALIRNGVVLTQPGKHCDWCPADGPHTCGDDIASWWEAD